MIKYSDKTHPDERTTLLQDALNLFTRGHLDEALQQAEDMLAVYDRDLQVMTLLGIIEDTRGDRASAEQWINRALEIDPKYPEALFYKGVFAGKDGQFAVAVRLFEQAVSVLPEDAHLERAEYLCSLGAALWNNGRLQDAIDAWKKAQRENPDHTVAAEYLKRRMNIYGHPKGELPELDDLDAFQREKISQYLHQRGLQHFQDTGEMDRVLDCILETWGAVSREMGWQQLDARDRLAYFRNFPINFP